MPVSGLLVTLVGDPSIQNRTLSSLARHDNLEIGRAVANRVPVVVDTESSDDDQEVWHWLTGHEGVIHVDVVCVHDFDSTLPENSRGPHDKQNCAIVTEGNVP